MSIRRPVRGTPNRVPANSAANDPAGRSDEPLDLPPPPAATGASS